MSRQFLFNMFLIGLAEGVEQNRRTHEGCIMYYTIIVIHLPPMYLRFLGNMFLIGLAEVVEQNRRTHEGYIMYYTILVIHLLPVSSQFLGNMSCLSG